MNHILQTSLSRVAPHLVVVTASLLCATSIWAQTTPSPLSQATPPLSFRLGEEIKIKGQSFFVERRIGGKILLAPPQPPTASLGAFIAPVAATASSFQGGGAGRLPSKIIDSSGWTESFPRSGVFTHTSNAYQGGSNSWNTSGERTAWVSFDLGKPYRVNGVYAWNYNEKGAATGYGAKKFDLLSSDDGQNFQPVGTYELAIAPGADDYQGQLITLEKPTQARYFKFEIRSNHGGNGVGLSEVRFSNADEKPVVATAWQPRYARPQHPKVALGRPLAGEDNFSFPADAGIVDVTKQPYNAKGDGITDDTLAIQKALDDHPNQGAIIYLPNGIYRISGTLTWPKGDGKDSLQKTTSMMGQSRRGTVLQLQDGSPGFEDVSNPQGVIYTGRKPAQRFGNEVRSLTIDTGVDNPGACGMQFMANNQGGVYDVTIISGDGQGVAGLDMAYSDEEGPLLIKNVDVKGFDLGVRLAHTVASVTMENVSVSDQNVAGIRNDGQPLSLRRFQSRNAVPAVAHNGGLLTLVDCSLVGQGNAATQAAIITGAEIFARNIQTQGYRVAIDDRMNKRESAGPRIAEYRSSAPTTLLQGAPSTLNLTIQETPSLAWDALDQWVAPQKFGAVAGDQNDDSTALQKAIDAGASTVYLPRGNYFLDSTVIIRGNVKRIIGCRANLKGARLPEGQPMFRFEDGAAPLVYVQDLITDFSSRKLFMEHASKRTLVLHRMLVNFQSGVCYRNTGTGPLFIEDMVGSGFEFTRQTVFARQFNPEPTGAKIINDGGQVWVLGLKSERGGTMVDTRNGGRSEILGGLSQTAKGSMAPLFINTDSDMSVVLAEVNYSNDPYRQLVVENKQGQQKEWATPDAKFKGFRLVSYEGRLSGKTK